MARAAGIDPGTTNSVVAVLEGLVRDLTGMDPHKGVNPDEVDRGPGQEDEEVVDAEIVDDERDTRGGAA